MRYKPTHKQETHQRIVETAAREFRTHGFEGVGIAKLMGDLHLTHGGFYAHFPDKEHLVAEANDLVFNEWLGAMVAAIEAGHGFPGIIDYYLSDEHCASPESGCLLPSLSAEVARRPAASRDAFTRRLTHLFETLADHMPGGSPEEKQSKIYALFAGMVGAVSLARASSDPALSKAIRESTRHYLHRLVDPAAQ